MKTYTMIDSPIGVLALVNNDGVLCGLYTDAADNPPAAEKLGEKSTVGFEATIEQLTEYFAGERTEFTVPVAPDGDRFQRRVWRELTTIPYGTTRSYGEVATAIGDPAFARAVGSANARNPISIIIPCHRVIGANGTLTGYAGGLERKAFLLALEQPDRPRQSSLF